MVNYLTVCRSNMNRSPMARDWLAGYCAGRGIKAEVRSAGMDTIGPMSDSYTQLTRELAEWADVILVMQDWMEDEIRETYPDIRADVHCLHIPDIFKPGRDDSCVPDMSEEEIREYMNENIDKRFGPKLFSQLIFYRAAPVVERYASISSSP